MESYIHKLYELKDAMEQGIENVKKVSKSQEELIRILNHSGPTETDFTEFKEECAKQVEDYGKQAETLKERLVIVKKLIDTYELGKQANATEEAKKYSETMDEIISDYSNALGLFTEE